MKKLFLLTGLVAFGLSFSLLQADEKKSDEAKEKKESAEGRKGKDRPKREFDPEKRAAFLLKNVDKDGDGVISAEEWKNSPMAQKMRERAEQMLERQFKSMDANDDGQLDKEELSKPPKRGPHGGPGARGHRHHRGEGKHKDKATEGDPAKSEKEKAKPADPDKPKAESDSNNDGNS